MKYAKIFKKAYDYEEGEAQERATSKGFWDDHEIAMNYVNKIRTLCNNIEDETYAEAVIEQFELIVSAAKNGIITMKGI